MKEVMTSVDLARAVGEQIRHYRSLKGWTQEQLAAALDTQGTYIGRVERGEQNVQLNTLEKIADALHISVYAFFAQPPFDQLKNEDWIWQVVMLLKQQDNQEQQRAYRVLKEIFCKY